MDIITGQVRFAALKAKQRNGRFQCDPICGQVQINGKGMGPVDNSPHSKFFDQGTHFTFVETTTAATDQLMPPNGQFGIGCRRYQHFQPTSLG